MDKGAVTFGSSANSRIILVGSKPRNDRGFSCFCYEETASVAFRLNSAQSAPDAAVKRHLSVWCTSARPHAVHMHNLILFCSSSPREASDYKKV